MNARTWITGGVTLALLCCHAPAASAFGTDGPLIKALRDLVAGNITAYDKKDLNATMSSIDTKSPDYESTKAALTEQFKDLDVTAQLVDFDYIGHDANEFAVARVKTKTTGKPGSGFTDNTVDAIVIFHQENGVWKLWSEKILGVDLGQ
jgi:hypothetical protein